MARDMPTPHHFVYKIGLGVTSAWDANAGQTHPAELRAYGLCNDLRLSGADPSTASRCLNVELRTQGIGE